MASKVVQMVFVVLSVMGLMGVIICCALPEWAVGYHNDKEVHVGLWRICVKYRTGLQECGLFENIATVPPPHASRTATVFSCMLGILNLLILFSGTDFTPCVQNQNKTIMILAAGVGLELTGLLLIMPLNWEVNVWVEGVRLGACIYIGYLVGLMLILSGVLLCCFGRAESSSFGGIVSCLRNRV